MLKSTRRRAVSSLRQPGTGRAATKRVEIYQAKVVSFTSLIVCEHKKKGTDFLRTIKTISKTERIAVENMSFILQG